jgi:hypothetical protein
VDLGFPGPWSASPRPIPRESGRRRPDWAAGGGGWIGRGASGSNWDREAHERRKKQHAFLFGLSLPLGFDLVCGDGGLVSRGAVTFGDDCRWRWVKLFARLFKGEQ